MGGQHEEWIGQGIGLAADGQLAFLGGFQKGALRFGRCAVDFVGQDHVAEEGAWDEAEDALAGGVVLFEDVSAGDVGGHQIGGELDSAEGLIEQRGEGGDHEGFGQAGNAFQNAVAAAEKGDHQLFDDLFLADNDPLHAFGDLLVFFMQLINCLDIGVHFRAGIRVCHVGDLSS